MKGAIQIDYIIAAGIFFMVFAFTINFLTDYLTTTKELSDVTELRSRAISLLGMADREFSSRIGLQSDAYRFYILVNNTPENLIIQNETTDLSNELVEFNLSMLGSFDEGSIAIYYAGSRISYNKSDDMIRFVTGIGANQSKLFIVYFDDDSNFTENAVEINYSDNIRETIYPMEKISLLQYRNIQRLGNSDYSVLKNTTGDFYLTIYDSAGNKFFGFGGAVPRKGDVIALERYIIYQNSTAGIENGSIIVQTW
jgi:hypothetical protein